MNEQIKLLERLISENNQINRLIEDYNKIPEKFKAENVIDRLQLFNEKILDTAIELIGKANEASARLSVANRALVKILARSDVDSSEVG
jgi:hypothetical protein